ncbi:MAG: hypothetical protein H0W33_06100 [Gammaproteobacteria bacterium]|nr:hypothetical protein [Gammaproteobacteria bacterium]
MFKTEFFNSLLTPAAVILAVLLVWPAAAQAQAILSLEVVEPRTFGYAIGDTLRREVHLSLRAEYHLENASLPKSGRLNRWLELAPPEIRTESIEDGRRYRLVFTYQILNAPRQLETVTLPQLNLGFTDDTQPLTTLVPALQVTVTPLTPDAGPDSSGLSPLQPDRAPAPIPVEERKRRFSWLVSGLLSLLAYGAARRWLMPVFAAGKLPFATAVRELKRSQRGKNTPGQYAAGLRIVHQAVNETAGRVVFAANLDEFLEAHPRFGHLRAEFARVFAASRKVFFSDADGVVPPDSSLPALLFLCRQCSRIERSTLRLGP